MKKYLFKLFILFSPVIFVILVYLINDPYKVLYHYNSYYKSGAVTHIQLDKDYVSTQNFLNKYPIYNYDSYIFGNSRSMYYSVDEWKKHITGNSFYHFDASGESIYGIEKKLIFLENKSVNIKNSLFIIDAYVMGVTSNEDNIVSIKHPALSGESKLDFELHIFKYFADVKFLRHYLDFLMSGKFKPSMSGYIINEIFDYNDVTNEVSFPLMEKAIKDNRDSFYLSRATRFFKRDSAEKYEKSFINKGCLEMLDTIKNILIKNHTNYKIVISPMYNQMKMNKSDLAILNSIFGAKNVYDFSGINDITNDIHNYYEESHYRPFIANRIMDSIYAN